MKTANATLKTFLQSWEVTCAARPNELNFAQYGFPGLIAQDFTAVFQEWSGALDTAVESTKSANAASEKVIESIIVKALLEIKALTESARGNGFAWLISSGFLSKVGDLQSLMTPVITKRLRLRKELSQFAKTELIGEITTVERAAQSAKDLTERQREIQEQAEMVASALAKTVEARIEAEKSAEMLSDYTTNGAANFRSIAEVLENINTVKGDIDEKRDEAKEIIDTANDLLEAVGKTKDAADDMVQVTLQSLKEANEKLVKALGDINRQALANSLM